MVVIEAQMCKFDLVIGRAHTRLQEVVKIVAPT